MAQQIPWRADNDDRKVVHILRSGRALCQQPGVPASWPANHVWVAWNDVPRHLKRNEARYCPTCKGIYTRDRRMQIDRSHRRSAKSEHGAGDA